MSSKLYESGISGFEDALEMFCELPEGQLALVAAKLGGKEGIEAMEIAIRLGNGLEDIAVLAAMFGDGMLADFVVGHKDFRADKPGELFELMPLAAAITCGNVECAMKLLDAGADMFAPVNQDVFGHSGTRPAILGANEQMGASDREIMAIGAVLNARPGPLPAEKAQYLMGECMAPVLRWCAGWTDSEECREAGLGILRRLIRDGAPNGEAYQMALKAVCQDAASSKEIKPGVEFYRLAKEWGELNRAQCSGILGRMVYGVGQSASGAVIGEMPEEYKAEIMAMAPARDGQEAVDAFRAMLSGAKSGLSESWRFGFCAFDSARVAGNVALFGQAGQEQAQSRCLVEALGEPGLLEKLSGSAAGQRIAAGAPGGAPESLDALIRMGEELSRQKGLFGKDWKEGYYVAGLMAALKLMAPEMGEKVDNLSRCAAQAAFAKSNGVEQSDEELALRVEAALLDLALAAAPKSGPGALRV